ncbi:MAG: acyltransferase family protein [Velocimicrobium sp.]
MNDFHFSKKDTQIAKGVAILLMVYHHLFAYNRIPKTYIPLLPTVPLDLISVLSKFGTICISIFMLLTGIGFFYVSQALPFKKWRIQHFLRFLFHYWLIFLLFIPVGFLIFHRSFHWNEFFLNFFLLSDSYNMEWWYIRVYLELLLFSPWIIKYIRQSTILSLSTTLIMSLIGYFLHESCFYVNPFIKELSTFLLWQLFFYLGFQIACHQFFHHLFQFVCKLNLNHLWFSFIILSFCIVVRQEPLIASKLKDPILAPLFLFFSVRMTKQLHLQKLIAYFGKHSLNIWLTHTFFCYYYLTNIVLLPHISILIFIWLLLLSLLSSHIINGIEEQLKKGLKKWKKKNIAPYEVSQL